MYKFAVIIGRDEEGYEIWSDKDYIAKDSEALRLLVSFERCRFKEKNDLIEQGYLSFLRLEEVIDPSKRN